MSIRPIDMQVTVQRTTDISKPQNQEGERPEIAQKHFTSELEKEVRLSDQTVIQSNKSEGSHVDKDGRGGGGDARGRSKRSRDEKNKESKEKEQPLSIFDVSV